MSAKKHPACKRDADHLIPLYPHAIQVAEHSIAAHIHTTYLLLAPTRQPAAPLPAKESGVQSYLIRTNEAIQPALHQRLQPEQMRRVRNTSIWCGVRAREMWLCQGQQYKRNNKVVKRGRRVGCESCVCLCYASRKRKVNTRSWMGGSEDAKEH